MSAGGCSVRRTFCAATTRRRGTEHRAGYDRSIPMSMSDAAAPPAASLPGVAAGGGDPRFEAIVAALSVAVLVFRRHQLIYANAAACQLRERLRTKYRSELT